jgi:hypothetical protein
MIKNAGGTEIKIKIPTHLLLFTFCFAILAAPASGSDFEVRLQHGTEREKLAEQQLRRVTAEHNLARWVQTRIVVIEEGAIPHSHPVLTLHTRHLEDDGLFVSTLIHEQMHWWLAKHPRQTEVAVRELKARYKTLPVGFPSGAASLRSSYEHLLVINLELDGVRNVLGEAEEGRVLEFWKDDHYTRLYRIVAADRAQINAIMKKRGLLIPPRKLSERIQYGNNPPLHTTRPRLGEA